MSSVFPALSPYVNGRVVSATFDPQTHYRRDQNARVEYGMRQWLMGGEPLSSRMVDTLRFKHTMSHFRVYSTRVKERELEQMPRPPILALHKDSQCIAFDPNNSVNYKHTEWIFSCLLALRTMAHPVKLWTVYIDSEEKKFSSLKSASLWILHTWRPVWVQDYHREYFEARS